MYLVVVVLVRRLQAGPAACVCSSIGNQTPTSTRSNRVAEIYMQVNQNGARCPCGPEKEWLSLLRQVERRNLEVPVICALVRSRAPGSVQTVDVMVAGRHCWSGSPLELRKQRQGL